MFALLTATVFARNSFVITTSGHCPPYWIFSRKISTSRK